MSRERYKTGSMWKLPRPKAEASSGVILKDMMELHIPSLLKYPDMKRNKTAIILTRKNMQNSCTNKSIISNECWT